MLKKVFDIWPLWVIRTSVRSIMALDGIKLDEPLGLPKGSIRAIITLGLLLFWGMTTSILIQKGLDVSMYMPSSLNDLTIMAVSFYIGARSAAGTNASKIKSVVKEVSAGGKDV